MANKMRWRYGDTKPVVTKPIASGTIIQIGDLVHQGVGGEVATAVAVSYGGSLAEAQGNLHDVFLGVAMQQSRDGDTDPIRVATAGVFEFDCAAAQFELGDLVGADDNLASSALLNQQVIEVTDESLAIGRVTKREGSNATKVLVEIVSTVMTGGAQAPDSSSGA